MKAGFKDYLWMDLRRAFKNLKILVGIFGVTMALLYNDYPPSDVVAWVGEMIHTSVIIMAAFMFAIFPYATAFCEDMEYQYGMQLVLRGNSFFYVCSKLIVVFISSGFTMFLGFLITSLIIYLRYGLPVRERLDDILGVNGFYGKFILQENYMIYFLCAGLQIACLAGTLAVIGLACSLFIKNRMLVYILPITFFYIEDIMAARFWGWEAGCLFSLNGMGVQSLAVTVRGQSWQMYYIEILMILICCGAIMCKKTERR